MKKQKKPFTDFEETEITCIGCGKKIKIVKLKTRKINDFLCQKCGKT